MEETLRLALARSAPSEKPRTAHEAAVAVVLAGPALEVLLIQRAEHPRDPWSGHMALPGGRRDPSDVNLLETAQRETLEEVGLHLAQTQLLGALDSVSAMSQRGPSGMRVSPYVFRLPSSPPETQANEEVADVVWVPLAQLASGELESHFRLAQGAQNYKFPSWKLDQRHVWGLTYRILSNLVALAREV